MKKPLIKQGPIAFMRGLTFPGGQQPVIEGASVYLRYPRIVDYAAWARLRAGVVAPCVRRIPIKSMRL